MKRKPIRSTEISHPDAEGRDWTHEGGRSAENGRSSIRIVCPFCRTTVTAFLWSLAGKGKRCECGAWIGNYGTAYRWRDA